MSNDPNQPQSGETAEESTNIPGTEPPNETLSEIEHGTTGNIPGTELPNETLSEIGNFIPETQSDETTYGITVDISGVELTEAELAGIENDIVDFALQRITTDEGDTNKHYIKRGVFARFSRYSRRSPQIHNE